MPAAKMDEEDRLSELRDFSGLDIQRVHRESIARANAEANMEATKNDERPGQMLQEVQVVQVEHVGGGRAQACPTGDGGSPRQANVQADGQDLVRLRHALSRFGHRDDHHVTEHQAGLGCDRGAVHLTERVALRVLSASTQVSDHQRQRHLLR